MISKTHLALALCVSGIMHADSCDPAYSLSANFLYFDAILDGTNFAITGVTSAVANQTRHLNYKSVQTDFHAGVRVGLQVEIPKHDFFDVGLFVTHHESSKSGGNPSSIATTQNQSIHFSTLPVCLELIPPVLFAFSLAAPITQTISAEVFKAENRWVDLEIGREFRAGQTHLFYIRPHFGLRYAKVKHRMHVIQEQTGTFQNDPNARAVIEQINKCAFDSLGLRFGINTRFDLWRNELFFHANMAWSYLCGEFDVNQSTLVTAIAALQQPQVGRGNRFSQKWISGKAMSDIFIGILYEKGFGCDKIKAALQVGWQRHQLYGQNQYLRLINGACKMQNHGDLLLRGLCLGLKLTY